jgi:uncharacterized repeat protein (TIGR01451 family)
MKRIATNRIAVSIGLVAGLAALLITLSIVLAAGESIPRRHIGSGGGEVSGGGLVLRNIVGQPIAGAVSNGLTVCSGFLCGPQVPSTGDTTAPSVTDISPVNGATGVPRNTPIVVSFSEAMNTSSVSTVITPSATLTNTWSLSGTLLTLTGEFLVANTRYTVTVSSGLDLAGNPLANAPFTWVFTTGADLVPEADLALDKAWTGPRNGTSELPGFVSAGGRITYTFTITNGGPTTPVTATLVDTFSHAAALAEVSGVDCEWTPGAIDVTCLVTHVTSSSPAQLTLIVTTSRTFSGTLRNNASVAPAGIVVDRNPANNTAGLAVTVRRESGGGQFIYLPLVVNP